MWGMPIIVAVQQSQLALYTTTSSAVSSASSSQSTSTIPSSTSTQTASPTPDRLSTGAKAGIAVGAVLGAIFLLSMGILFCRQRRKSIRTRNDLGAGDPMYQDGYRYQRAPVELGVNEHKIGVIPPVELSSGHQHAEMGT